MDRREATKYRPYEIDEANKQIILYAGDEEERRFLLEREVCPTCNGEGSHVNPSIDSQGLSADDFAEDPDFAEDYIRGTYDIPCKECNGLRVIATSKHPDFIKAMNQFWAEEAADRHTQMMESGGYGC